MVGSYVAQKAKERGWKVGGTSRSSETCPSAFLVSDEKGYLSAMDEFQPNIFVDCSAWTHVDACEINPEECIRINSLLPGKISSLAFSRGIFYVLISSSYVFPGEKQAYAETDLPNPLNWYGEAKALAEKLVLFHTRGKALVIRTMGVYGESADGKDFRSQVVRSASTGKRIQVASDQFGNFTFAGDLADVILKLVEWNSVGIWHVAGPEPVLCRSEIAKKICRLGGWDENTIQEVSTPELHQKAARPRFGGLSIQKILSKGLEMRTLEQVWSK